ncbi:HipA domain-containing protein [Ramlibacter sp. WS9]|uniref:HipA domain-containing protein n=1 Tax=Ramlibacter sp. WS9 TaxID=1882741 RepID=UPI00130536E2|nr:HipA domain-containing protein [Ramlibacter sp. WS9]
MLRPGPRTAQELMSALGISQPTLSRTIHSFPEALVNFRVSGDRTPKYGLLRKLPGGLNPRQKVYRISDTGSIEPFADVAFLSGGATLESGAAGGTLYEGLPPYMAFSSPSGFLGRQIARAAASEMQFPESLKDWGDDHRIAYLFTRSLNLAGNLVYGEASLQREVEFRKAPATPVADKRDHYVAMANELKDAAYGSSAGGEQPKFLGLAQDTGHVIVKFAKEGSRMAELLPLEHLALRALEAVNVPVAQTQLDSAGGYVFLEVQRFDRVSRHGRVGMLSCGSIDDEFFGARDSWSEFAARCEQARYLDARDARNIDVMAAFSELIGNSDRHFENISMLLSEDGEYAGVAPAYDILPMRYASIGGGVDPDLLPINPKLGTIGAKPAVWALAAKAAIAFWTAVRQGQLDLPISEEIRELAAQNLAVVQDFVEPLLPPGNRSLQ